MICSHLRCMCSLNRWIKSIFRCPFMGLLVHKSEWGQQIKLIANKFFPPKWQCIYQFVMHIPSFDNALSPLLAHCTFSPKFELFAYIIPFPFYLNITITSYPHPHNAKWECVFVSHAQCIRNSIASHFNKRFVSFLMRFACSWTSRCRIKSSFYTQTYLFL